ncbi:MAG: DNA-deoxyinosine glycosylase [Clostridia bacterium]|nr:DNA-deoxyinosine glycosylase [Clostridia bacterium]
MERERVHHILEPWYTDHSTSLILGTIPSPKSREYGCYYGHPQNRFWKTIATVFEEATPETTEDRYQFISRHRLALWDVLESCDIRGAEDSAIIDPIANDLSIILKQAPIKRIFTTGKKAKELYDTLLLPSYGIEAVALPSTSPANRRWFSDEALIEAYRIIPYYQSL